MKRQVRTGRRYLQTKHLTNDLYLEYVKSFQNSTVTKNPVRIWAKDRKRYFTEEDIHIANKYMKRCFTY